MGCPYEGKISADKVYNVAKTLQNIGCYEIALEDTNAAGTTQVAIEMFDKLTSDKTVLNPNKLAARFRHCDGHFIPNLAVALAYNINSIDCGAAAMGAFPYSGIRGGIIST